MTTEAYVRDARFECHGAAISSNGDRPYWVNGADLPGYLNQIALDWSKTAILAHHAHFDGLILAHHYGIKPALWLDTLSMARLLIGNHLSVSLGSFAQHFGLAAKDVPYDEFKGKRWVELSNAVQVRLANGSCHDVAITWDIFCRLAKDFPQEEYGLVDATVRMFTEPKLVGDTALLGQIWSEEQASKAA